MPTSELPPLEPEPFSIEMQGEVVTAIKPDHSRVQTKWPIMQEWAEILKLQITSRNAEHFIFRLDEMNVPETEIGSQTGTEPASSRARRRLFGS